MRRSRRVPLRQPDDRAEPDPRPRGPAWRSCCSSGSLHLSRDCPQPIREDSLLDGPLEPTNEAYALAKIAGIKLCQAYRRQYGCDFISAMPTNLYGPGDNFDLMSSHVVPALIRKMHEAKQAGAGEVESGAPARRGASSCTSTTWPTPACSCSSTDGDDDPYQRRLRRGPNDRRACPDGAGVVGFAGGLASIRPPGRHAEKLLDISRLRAGLAAADPARSRPGRHLWLVPRPHGADRVRVRALIDDGDSLQDWCAVQRLPPSLSIGCRPPTKPGRQRFPGLARAMGQSFRFSRSCGGLSVGPVNAPASRAHPQPASRAHRASHSPQGTTPASVWVGAAAWPGNQAGGRPDH